MTFISYYEVYEKSKHQNKGNGLKLFSSFMLEPNPTSAYLLGYLWADAYIKTRKGIPEEVILEVVEEDAKYLIPLFQSLGSISTSARQRPNRQPQTTIRLASPILASVLIDLGLCKGRLDCSNVAESLPVSLRRFFVLGVSDGDGCIYVSKDRKVNQFSISACLKQDWTWIKKSVLMSCSVALTECERKTSSLVRVTGRQNLTRLGSWLYQGHPLGLPRKRDKWLGLIGAPTKRKNLLSDDDAAQIIEQVSLGVKYKHLSDKFGVSEKFISKLKMKGGYKKNSVTPFTGS